MTRPKGRVRRERRLVDMTVAPAPADWRPAPSQTRREDCKIDLFDDDRVVIRQSVDSRNQVVDFSMTQQTLEDGVWSDVCRVDCSHDEVHVHWFDVAGRQVDRTVIRPITCIDEVHRGWDEASDIVFEGWQENLQRRASRGR